MYSDKYSDKTNEDFKGSVITDLLFLQKIKEMKGTFTIS